MKKKILAIMLCAVMALSVCACGDGGQNTEKESEKTQVDPPTLKELATFDDLKAILVDDYEITDEVLEAGFVNLMFGAGGGLIEVTDRDVVQEGDVVKVDYTGYLDDKAFSGGAAEDQYIDVSNNCAVDTASGPSTAFIPNFSDGLIGAKIDEEVRHNVTFPENYSNTDLAGKETTFVFEVSEIYTMVSPDTITDDYVKEYMEEGYELTTVEGLMNYIREELTYQAVVGYVIDNSEVTIPETYIDYRLTDYEEYFIETQCGGYDVETILQYYYGMTLEQARVEWAEALKSQIKVEVIFSEIVKAKGLTLDEAGHEEYVQEVLDVNDYFKEADDIYRYAGAGSAEAGKTYLMNETAVRDSIMEQYHASIAETE